jgi:(1->4)-alpha-D-glucan 1-alpha-D-glucosylmutase
MRIPTATYRLQLHKDFGFARVREIIDYLRALGISDIYASPIFKARAGSLHGYDVVDPNQINPELGSEQEFAALADELKSRNMGWLQDIVPNHMAYDSENLMLMDVLENGPNSPFADFFDIEWDHLMGSMRGKVLAPCLGQFYGQCLESGDLVLGYDAHGLAVHYYQQRFPISLESYSQVLAPNMRELRRKLGRQHPDLIKLLGVLYTLKNLPSSEENQDRTDQILFIRSMLWELYTTNDEIKKSFDENVAQFNGRPGDPESFNALDRLLGQQYYRLSFWKVATEEINYRRFFNINDLISLRIEDSRVFDATHVLLSRLIRENKISGLRIDHIDGLYDPVTYLKRLHKMSGDSYMVVEKILSMEERLPTDWPISGTTGYDFTNYVNGLFCQSKNEGKLSDFYTRFTGLQTPYGDLVSEKKRLIIGRHMAGDVDRLANLLKRISSTDRFGGDITLYGLKRALVEVLTFFPVYRTYITPDSFSAEDRQRIRAIMNRAKEMNPALLHELAFIEKFLLLEYSEHTADEEKAQWVHFIMRLQQLTGPLMAKGFEDTTLYLYNRLLSLNEVGGNPGQFGVSLESFHQFNDQRLREWPHALNATSTHDTKRGEDVRARINVLSEIPDEWEAQVFKWSAVNSQHKQWLKGREVPDRNDEYFLYQSLIGVWPLTDEPGSVFLDRVKTYMIKAVREAKVHTEWLKPDTAYESAFLSFIEDILRGPESNPFLAEFLPFARKISHFGALNSLAQTLLKITSPGVPDFYQGTELWDLNFVDPDNRRPVDFDERRKLLDELRLREEKDSTGLLRELTADPCSSRLKLFVTYKGLVLRQSQRSLFDKGKYLPLYAVGPRKEHVGAFARHDGRHWALTIVPRYLTEIVETRSLPLGKSTWLETKLALPEQAPEHWIDIFTNEKITTAPSKGKKLLSLSCALKNFPVALLVADGFHDSSGGFAGIS